jgi:guanine deaminase
MTGFIRGPMLIPRADRTVEWIPDGEMSWDDAGKIRAIGPATAESASPRSRGVILPPFLDCHTHIPQWPIRGKFCDGVDGCPDGGRLLAGLNRNVFPTEGKCDRPVHVRGVVESFAADTLSHGVVGGAAFMTVHAAATETALTYLSPLWHVGLVLMNMNCPAYLRTDEANLDRDITGLAETHGKRLIVTDRFAVAVDSPLRRRAVKLAERFDLRMQTHLNEQVPEKDFVEQVLYRGRGTYTDVYDTDGLLNRRAILAHCVQMSESEFDLVARRGAVIAHCPTSNAVLDSGVMPLDRVLDRGIPYAICTDVGASPTTSILVEMAVFLNAHAGRCARATAVEALYRTTLGAAKLLGVSDRVGDLSVGKPATFIEIQACASKDGNAETVIRSMLPEGPETISMKNLQQIADSVTIAAGRLDSSVARVTIDGVEKYSRELVHR